MMYCAVFDRAMHFNDDMDFIMSPYGWHYHFKWKDYDIEFQYPKCICGKDLIKELQEVAKRIKTKRPIEKLKKDKPNFSQFKASKSIIDMIHERAKRLKQSIDMISEALSQIKMSSSLNNASSKKRMQYIKKETRS
ncbi:hypothetical protein EFS61_09375 [Lactobacillus hominis]|nr:hypothetical protein [Lactobacillus hominis]